MSSQNIEVIDQSVIMEGPKRGKQSPQSRSPKKLPWNNSTMLDVDGKRIRKSGSSVFETSKISARSQYSHRSHQSVESLGVKRRRNEAANVFYDKNLGKALQHYV